MRVFIAIDFTTEEKELFFSESEKLQKIARKGTFVKKNNLHLTLQFLGECTSVQIERLKTMVAGLKCAPFNIRVSKLGSFLSNDYGRTYYLMVEDSKELERLAKLVIELTSKCGIEAIPQKFVPHITLGRRVVLQQEIGESVGFHPTKAIKVDQITLFESKQHIHGIVYIPIVKSKKKEVQRNEKNRTN